MHRNDTRAKSLHQGNVVLYCRCPDSAPSEVLTPTLSHLWQEILRANAYVKTAADLSTRYRKNVQYNLEANKPEEGQ